MNIFSAMVWWNGVVRFFLIKKKKKVSRLFILLSFGITGVRLHWLPSPAVCKIFISDTVI